MSYALEAPSPAPEQPLAATRERLDAAGSDVLESFLGRLETAWAGVQNPETRSASWASLIGLFAALAVGDPEKFLKTKTAERPAQAQGAPAPLSGPAPPVADIPSDEIPSDERTRDAAMDAAEVTEKEPGARSGAATDRIPYRFFAHGNLANSGCPGYRNGGGEFDRELATRQLQALGQDGFKTVILLARHDEVEPVLEGVHPSLDYRRAFFRTTSDLHPDNIRLFEVGAAAIQNGKAVFICRHGTHRSVAAAAGAWMASGQVNSLEEAFTRAGGNLANFRAYPAYIHQLTEYAKWIQQNRNPNFAIGDRFVRAARLV